MRFSHRINTLKYCIFIIKTIFISFFLNNLAYSEGTKIGSITELNGEVIAITEEGDERVLDVFDEIFLKDEVLIGESSSATLQFNDNTTIVMKELTSLNVSEFENSPARKTFQAKVGKGKIIIESGAIAKNSSGEMLVDLSNMSLGIRGTRFNANIKPNGNSEVALAEDSFGTVGQIEISSEGQTTSLTSTDQVIEVTETNEIAQREQSEDEKQELKSVNETLVKVSKIDENELTQQLQEKLAKGKLQDANNDGIVDETDIEAAKEIIKEEKKQKIDFIVENSSDENTTFLSDVIDQSDEQNIGETIEKIIETKDTLVEGVVGNLSDKDNTFLTTTTSEGAGLIKEKIFETIVAKETDKSAEVLSKVMAKADTATINSVINNITEKNTNQESKLSLKVMADFSEKNPEKLETLAQTNKDQVDKLTVAAVQKASTSNEDAGLIAKVVAVASDEIANKVVEEVSKNATSEKQSLSAKVLKAIVDTQPNKIETLNEEIKTTIIKQTLEAAKNQEEGGLVEEDNLSDVVADIVVKTDAATASKVIEEVNNTETESSLSLKVMSGISDKDANKINQLAETNKESIDKLTEKAVQSAKSTNEDSQLIAKVVAVASDEIANKVVEEVSKNATSEKQSLSAKVLKAIVDTQPNKIETLNEEIKTTIIKQTLEAAKNQEEGGLIEEDNLSDVVADIVVKTDAATASKVIEEVNNTETESSLSLKVMSGISDKDANKINQLAETNKESIDKLTEKAVQSAKSTNEDSQLIAKVVAVASDEIANKVVEEVSKNATSEKQSLSAKVLKAIVDTQPNKIETLNEEIKTTIIKQTLEAAKNQEEGGLVEEDNLSDVVADIVVKTDAATASKVIEEVNNTETESSLSLKVMSGISDKDANKINQLAETNKESIDKLTEKAVQSAKSTNEDSQLIAKVVAVASDEIANKVVEEVSKNATSEKQSLSAKVLKAIVDTQPNKIETLNEEIKTTVISQAIEAAKNQQEGTSSDDEDLSNTVAEIVTKADNDTAAKVLESLDEATTGTESKLALNVVNNLTKQENYEEKIEILSVTSSIVEQNITKLVEKAVESVQSEEDLEIVTNLVENSKGTLSNKVLDSANNNEATKKKVSEVIVKIVEKNPEKAVEIIEKNQNTNTVTETIKTKIENNEAVTTEDFEDVFETNVSPN